MSSMTSTVEGTTEIRPFRVDVPEEELAELRRRLAAMWEAFIAIYCTWKGFRPSPVLADLEPSSRPPSPVVK